MSRTALYQKYRSQTFSEVVGQEYIVQAIQNAIRENKVGHAYLFCGPRGTGKTTMARLLARAVNCSNKAEAPCGACESCVEALEGNHPDIIEMNAANETHVEDIRDLIERAQLAPMMGTYKVYIIDEVHQLSTSASSALLKTLEEPPKHVIFILATTDPQKLLPTIISRCQRFDFSKVETEKIQRHLLNISEKEGIALTPEAAYKIAEIADGGMRDALSILEQASSYEMDEINEETINSIFGLASNTTKMEFLEAIFHQDLAKVITMVREAQQNGIDLKFLTADLSEVLKDTILFTYTEDEGLLRVLTRLQAKQLGSYTSVSQLLEMMKILNDAVMDYRNTANVLDYFEFICMKLMSVVKDNSKMFHVEQSSSCEKQAELPQAQPSQIKPVEKPQPKPVVDPKPVVEEKLVEPVVEEEEMIQEVQPEELVEAREERIPTKDEIKRPLDNEHEEVPLSLLDVVGILNQCDKQSKAEDEVIFQKITGGFKMNRYVGLLQQCQIAASGKNCVLFMTQNQASANLIQTLPLHKELYFYLKEEGWDKMPYAISVGMFQDAVNKFVELSRINQLPDYKIAVYQEDPTKRELTSEEKVLQLFGDHVEIIEE